MKAEAAWREFRCSFCGTGQSMVDRLIAGPGGVYICNECVELTHEIIHEAPSEVVSIPPPSGPPAGPAWQAGVCIICDRDVAESAQFESGIVDAFFVEAGEPNLREAYHFRCHAECFHDRIAIPEDDER